MLVEDSRVSLEEWAEGLLGKDAPAQHKRTTNHSYGNNPNAILALCLWTTGNNNFRELVKVNNNVLALAGQEKHYLCVLWSIFVRVVACHVSTSKTLCNSRLPNAAAKPNVEWWKKSNSKKRWKWRLIICQDKIMSALLLSTKWKTIAWGMHKKAHFRLPIFFPSQV